jgi:hypothetical protein
MTILCSTIRTISNSCTLSVTQPKRFVMSTLEPHDDGTEESNQEKSGKAKETAI